MSSEAGHIQITEFNKEVIPMINWMMEDLFCQYGVSLPWFMCDFDFPDFSQRPDWVSGYNFNLDWGAWGYWLVKFNEMLGLLFDEAHLPRWQMPDLSPGSWAFFNDYTEILYDNMQRHYVYDQSGTFIKDEVIEGETSGITGWYKWIDGDGYIHVANKQDASGETVADFEEEKIVGADSGAYAWTYEGLDLPIYNTVGTFTVGQTLTGVTSGATGLIEEVSASSLELSSISGTFSDSEKVTCTASNAYAYTYEITGTKTVNHTSFDYSNLSRMGNSFISLEDAWDEHYQIPDIWNTWHNNYVAMHLYISP